MYSKKLSIKLQFLKNFSSKLLSLLINWIPRMEDFAYLFRKYFQSFSFLVCFSLNLKLEIRIFSKQFHIWISWRNFKIMSSEEVFGRKKREINYPTDSWWMRKNLKWQLEGFWRISLFIALWGNWYFQI